MAKDNGIVNIHGKDYKTVALRVGDFRQDFPGHSILTEIVKNDAEMVIVKAMILQQPEGIILATGHAEEKRNSSQINRTSALENCETSAIGRAIALMGSKYMGKEFCSADELANALNQQKHPAQAPKQSQQKPAQKPSAPVASSTPAEPEPPADMLAPLVKKYHAMCAKRGIGEDMQKEMILHFFDKHSRTELTEKEYMQLIEHILPRGKEWLLIFIDVARGVKSTVPHVQSASSLMLHLRGELRNPKVLEVGTEQLDGYRHYLRDGGKAVQV